MSETQHHDSKDPQQIDDADGNPDQETESEFRVTIRKLELPVRPRGVLAD